MSRLSFWLTGGKNFINNFKTIILNNRLNSVDDFSVLSPSSVINYSSYLSSIYKKSKGELSHPANRVSSPDETFSFYREDGHPSFNRKIIWLWNIQNIPPRYRAGLAKLASKYPDIIKSHFFVPSDISYDLAGKSDFFLLKKNHWLPVLKEFELRLPSLMKRRERIPSFSDQFTLKEKIILRLLFKLRKRFIPIDEISGYLYGRHMKKHLRASAFIVFALRKKLDRLTGQKNFMQNYRKFGYKVDFDLLREKRIVE